MIFNYFVYILTNANRSVLYIGVTNDLQTRLHEHYIDSQNTKRHFTGKYNVYYLIYWERYHNINDAIDREKELKGWRRSKKEELINVFNPSWIFLNDEV